MRLKSNISVLFRTLNNFKNKTIEYNRLLVECEKLKYANGAWKLLLSDF